MATHSLGKDTCNLSVNVKTRCRNIIGKLSYDRGDKSVGETVKDLLRAGLESMHPELIGEWDKALARAVIAAGACLLALSVMIHQPDTARRTKSQRTARVLTIRRVGNRDMECEGVAA